MGEYVKLCGKVGPRDDNGDDTLCRDEDTHVGGHTYLSAAAIEQARIRDLAVPAEPARPEPCGVCKGQRWSLHGAEPCPACQGRRG